MVDQAESTEETLQMKPQSTPTHGRLLRFVENENGQIGLQLTVPQDSNPVSSSAVPKRLQCVRQPLVQDILSMTC